MPPRILLRVLAERLHTVEARLARARATVERLERMCAEVPRRLTHLEANYRFLRAEVVRLSRIVNGHRGS